MEQGPGHFFITSSSFHFFHNTDLKQYLHKIQNNFLQIKTPEVLVLYKLLRNFFLLVCFIFVN